MGEVKAEELIRGIKKEIAKVIIQQEEVIDLLLISIFTGGHILLEGVPGLGKTLLIKSLAKTMGVEFKRVQFTPDLMPSDITGARVYNVKDQEFNFIRGPIFTNFLLGDEINRTPPKTQAGLLEAMEEGIVTIDGEDYKLSKPFIVFATQNPIEYEGTYPLPEALLDRFFMKIHMEYPSLEGELQVIKKYHKGSHNSLNQIEINQIAGLEDLINCQKEIANIVVEESLMEYIVNITRNTREFPLVEVGSSPRGAIALLQASKARAVLMERDFVIPEDIKIMAYPILRHRIILKPEAYLEGIEVDGVIYDVLENIKVPR